MTYLMSTTSNSTEAVLARRADARDAVRIGELARLDDKRVPAGPFLVAEVSGEIVAAVSLATGTVVADPFRLTGDSVAILRLRAAQVAQSGDLAARPRPRHQSYGGAAALTA
jgi:hypothetical protein